ncbi:MAG: hypothetical protein KY432_00810 [Acidobacteria bacterium]|nr:hypothetical protein [Acidobacteriota bacterium]
MYEKIFPLTESFIDFSGDRREFLIEANEGPFGWTVVAREINPPHDPGYFFSTFSASHYGLALGAMRGKIRREISRRYLVPDSMPNLLHGSVRGRVGGSDDQILVIDGRAISADDFVNMISVYEGHEFELHITEPE